MANEIKHDMWDYHPMDGVYNRPCTPEVPECDEGDYHVAHAPSAPMTNRCWTSFISSL